MLGPIDADTMHDGWEGRDARERAKALEKRLEVLERHLGIEPPARPEPRGYTITEALREMYPT